MNYAKYNHILYDPDYMNSLLVMLRGEVATGRNMGNPSYYKTVKTQYGLAGSKTKVLEQFETLAGQL